MEITNSETTSVESKFDVISTVSPFNEKTLDPLAFRPASVREKAVGNLITSSHPGFGHAAAAAFTVPANTSATFSFTLTDDMGRTQHAIADTSMYIGELKAANLWPNATYGMGNMPRFSEDSFNDSDNANVVHKMTIRNNVGLDVYVIAVCKFRIIVNNTLNFEQANSASSGGNSSLASQSGGQGGGL